MKKPPVTAKTVVECSIPALDGTQTFRTHGQDVAEVFSFQADIESRAPVRTSAVRLKCMEFTGLHTPKRLFDGILRVSPEEATLTDHQILEFFRMHPELISETSLYSLAMSENGVRLIFAVIDGRPARYLGHHWLLKSNSTYWHYKVPHRVLLTASAFNFK